MAVGSGSKAPPADVQPFLSTSLGAVVRAHRVRRLMRCPRFKSLKDRLLDTRKLLTEAAAEADAVDLDTGFVQLLRQQCASLMAEWRNLHGFADHTDTNTAFSATTPRDAPSPQQLPGSDAVHSALLATRLQTELRAARAAGKLSASGEAGEAVSTRSEARGKNLDLH